VDLFVVDSEPIMDVILRRGDVMYVPTGFPHTTDTCTTLDHETVPPTGTLSTTNKSTTPTTEAPQHRYDETSIHLTMGLETHVWALAYAHLRWALLQRCGKEFRVQIPDDGHYWSAMDTIPVGFLAGGAWSGSTDFVPSGTGTGTGEDEDEDGNDGYASDEQIHATVKGLKKVMLQLEPERWETEDMPTDAELNEVVRFMGRHVRALLRVQHELYSNVDPHDENTIVKAFQATKETEAVMERYGEFCKSDLQRDYFARRRLERDRKTANATL